MYIGIVRAMCSDWM